MNANIAVLPGDGIGPEVTRAAVDALRVIASRFDHRFEVTEHAIGGTALRSGRPALPPDTLSACLASDAVFLGAVGDPDFDGEPPDRRPESAILKLRRELGVFANLRPARVWPGLEDGGSLKPALVKNVDVLIVRELTGGLYYGEPRGTSADGEEAFNTMRYSRPEIERIADVAFQSAQQRRRRVASIDKANVLETSRLWRRVVTEKAAQYRDVELEHQYVDSCALMLAVDPGHYDVILAENLFGDILSDEAGAIVGSLGLLPSASLGGRAGLFEPVHGSAPTIAGADRANPIGAIASMAMLLRHGLGLDDEAAVLEAAIGSALTAGHRTSDLSGTAGRTSVGCAQMSRLIIDGLTTEPQSKPAASSR